MFEGVFHLAAVVGVGQSMYEIANYTSANGLGTAVLLEALAQHPVDRLVVASSMSIYGAGLYRTRDGELVEGRERTVQQLRAHDWEVRDEHGEPLTLRGFLTPLLNRSATFGATPSALYHEVEFSYRSVIRRSRGSPRGVRRARTVRAAGADNTRRVAQGRPTARYIRPRR